MPREDRTARPVRRWRRAVGIVVALAAIVTGVWLTRHGAQSAAVGSTAESTRRESAPPSVELVRPARGGIPRTIQQPASVQAFETVDLYALVSGYLKTQAVDIGSRIRKGEVLAEINVPRDAKAVEEAVALVEQARAQVVQAEAHVEVAKAERDAIEAAARQAESEVDRLKASRVLAEKQLARVQGLAERNAVDRKLVDEEQSVFAAAVAAERTSGIAVQTAKARALAAGAEVDKANADAIQAKASLGVAEARRDRVMVNLKYARIVAPFDGVVTHRSFHPGALILSGTEGGQQLPLLTVKRTDLMRVVVLVPDRDVALTKIGDRATLSVDALDDRTFTGTLARIARSENAERLMRVEIDLPNPDDLLCDGMYGKASIALERNPEGLTLPSACVFEHSGRSRGVVYVVRDSAAHRTEVKLGGDNGSQVEILSGLKPIDAVILRSSEPVEDGMRIAASL